MLTLHTFIEEQIKNYGIPVNKKNQKKIYSALRAKYTSELKKMGAWQKVDSKVIGRATTKLFAEKTMKEVAHRTQKYMIDFTVKHSGFTKKEVEKQLEKNQLELDQRYTNEVPNPYGPERGEQLEKSLDRLMLRALFKKFFTMTEEQKELFAEDRGKLYYDFDDVANSTIFALAQQRLKHPEKYYYTEKDQK